MTILTRTATFAALLTLILVPRLGAQSSKITVTIGGGAHAGTYEMAALYCDMHADQFPPIDFEANSRGTGRTTGPASISFFTGSGKGDGFVVSVSFHVKAGERGRYEIFAIPRELYPPGKAFAPSGSGTVTVKQTAAGKTASFRGQTKDGVKMEGIVDCRRRSS
jgi:hypothetical protein